MRLALRQLAKSPGFAFTAIATLALSIGACTAIFSVVNSVLLRPLAFSESERLVVIQETKLPEFPEFPVSPGNYFDWRAQSTSFEHLAALRGAFYNFTGTGEPIRIRGERITANYLSTLRTRPLLGRDFSAEEAASGARVALLSQGFWQQQFGGRPDILDETIQLDGQTFTIVGVVPEVLQSADRIEIFTPLAYTEESQNHGSHFLRVAGRLKAGVTLEQARSEFALIAERLARQYPDTNTGWAAKLTPLLESTVGNVRPVLFSLLGAVGFLLLIACANLASLLLARATARAKEISVRTALGASRIRIARQLLCESVLLAFIGGLLGVLVAQWSMSALVAFAPDSLPRAAEISLDARAFCFACLLVLLTGVGFGLFPAFHASRVNLNEALKDGGRGSSGGGRRQRVRGTLVVAEVAIALMLLVGAGLLIRSFARLQNVNPGFQPRDAFAASITLPANKYGTQPQQAAFVEQALTRLAAIPGVQCAGTAVVLPFSGDDFNLRFDIAGRPAADPLAPQSTLYYAVTTDYFKAMGIPLLRGRVFTAADGAGTPRVALINESLAKKFFPGQDPIGQRIKVTNAESEIVGIVANVKHYQLDAEAKAQTYEPFAQLPFNFMTFVVRLATPKPDEGGPALAAGDVPAAIRSAIHAVDKDQPVASVRPLTELLSISIARQRFAMFLFTVFSGVALLLAAIGIYGIMAYSVNQRTREMGLRMALGAQRIDVLRLIFLQGGKLVALGLVLGSVGALLLTRFITSMLYNVSAHDPVTFAAIAVLLVTVASLACFLPARRATKVDPLVALRTE